MSHETPFDIRLAPDASHVEVWSDDAPAFQPKEWKIELRDGIRAAVQRLRSSPGEMLDAYYYRRKYDKTDAENVLFYNIYASYFVAAGSHAIRFTRAFADPPAAPNRVQRSVYLRYEITSLAAPCEIWELQPTALARWDRVPLALPPDACRPSRDTKAGLYWLSMKQADPWLRPGEWNGFFALDLALHGPSPVNLTDVIKPLVDGLVASFQSHRGPIADTALSKLKSQLGASAPGDDVLRGWLSDSGRAVLGPQEKLALPKGNALWKARDHDCVLCRLRFELESDGQWFLSGVLNAVVRARVP